MKPNRLLKSWANASARKQIKPAAFACLLALTATVRAGDSGWNAGDNTSDWNDVANWDSNPTGNNLNINWYGGPPNGIYPVISADQSIQPGSDVKVGEFGGTGYLDHTAGSATNGNLVLGWAGGTGTYNLCDTTTSGGALTGYGQGSGTMDLTGAFILGSFFGADGGTETNNINTTGGMNINYDMYVGKGNGTATLNMDAGTISQGAGGGSIWVGFNGDTNVDYPAVGNMNVGGGSVTANWRINVGSIDTGNVNSSGNLNSNNVGVVTLNGGTMTANGPDFWDGGVRIGAWGGSGTFNLNGGTLACRYVFSEGNADTNGISVFNFNGGTLKPTQDRNVPWDVFFGGWPGNYGTDYRYLTSAYVQSGGAIIDTAGYYVIFSQPLLTGTNITDGGLVKNGAGTMEFDGNGSTFTGPVVVNGGTLYANPGSRANNNDFSYCSSITVNSNATLETSGNGLFGWDGSQAQPITINDGTITADAGGDVVVGQVTLNGGTMAGGPNSGGWGSWSFGRASVNSLTATANSTVTATNMAFYNGATIGVASGKTLTISGTIDDSSNGQSSLIKSGDNGTLVLSGANTYTGNTVVNAGTLELAQPAATLATNSTVTIASGAVLKLDNGTVTNTVNAFVLNGTAKPAGVYGASNSSGYITGSGHLLVLTGPSVGPSSPDPITSGYNASTRHLTLTWPSGKNWRLVSQTNSLSTGLSSTGWSTVAGFSDGSVTITVNPAAPSVFYRLVYP